MAWFARCDDSPVPDADVLEVVAGARASHARLIEAIESVTDADARAASLLPGWSVGHVLTHIARNAESFVRMMGAAMAGRAVQQYDGGSAARAAAIEAGAGRPAAELIGDIVASAWALEQMWEAMTPAAWAGHGLTDGDETWPCTLMPFHRWREVELHHVDLGFGYAPQDWPAGYVRRELTVSLAVLPERLSPGDRQRLLGWLVGRGEQPTDVPLAPWQARREHYLRS
jgi:maleylpyruvate isomerase